MLRGTNIKAFCGRSSYHLLLSKVESGKSQAISTILKSNFRTYIFLSAWPNVLNLAVTSTPTCYTSRSTSVLAVASATR